MQIQLTTIADEDVESYCECLDVMARERKYLHFWKHYLSKTFEGSSHATAPKWWVGADRLPWWHHTLRHCGALGMHPLTGYHGRGLGKAFFGACLSVWYKRVSHGWNSRPEKTTCVRSHCKDINAANGSCRGANPSRADICSI